MIDTFTILFIGGKVLWSKTFIPVNGNPINKLIKTVLLAGSVFQETAGVGDKEFVTDAYKLQWTLANEFGLVFVVCYQKIIQLLYVDELLFQVKEAFCHAYKESLSGSNHTQNIVYDFDEKFAAILRAVEQEFERESAKAPKPVPAVKETKDTSEPQRTVPLPVDDDEVLIEEEPESPISPSSTPSSTKKPKGKPRPKGAPKNAPKPKAKAAEKKPERRTKKPAESWRAALTGNGGASSSTEVATEEMSPEVLENMRRQNNVTSTADPNFTKWERKPKDKNSGWGWMKRFGLGDRELEEGDLDKLLADMKDRLMSKNVNVEVAELLCKAVNDNLVGTKIGKFERLSTRIRECTQETLSRILTPKEDRNILREIDRTNERGKPYVIVFCGVNGVGKSTNLAKICFWLKKNGKNVMLAACDTFRAGAVEQLKVHADCLEVPIFQQGYGKDAASIAHDAITKATHEGKDVVLVDTAGRMQDNEPLMRALVKLVMQNNPDLVLFVGEALVGNDAVDQLAKFNQSLRDMSTATVPHTIDGIVLTKFDTIDDKVGAAVSMVHTTQQPIVFVGVGQTYTDLRKFDVDFVVDALLN